MWKAAVVVCALLAAVASAKVDLEDGVLVGTDDNLDSILKENEYALLEFYAPWCGHCKHLAPEYAKAAQQLAAAKSPVKLVKIDATVHQNVAEEYEVQGYPTIKWYKKGRSTDYSGGRTADEIVKWVNRKSGPPARALSSVDEVKQFAAANEVVILGVFENTESAEAQAFSRAADMSEFNYGIAISDAIAAEYKLTKPGVAVLKTFDELRVDYKGELTAEAIHKFALSHQLPLVVEFSDASAQKIFGGEVKSHLIAFIKRSSADFDAQKRALGEAAADVRGKILFVFINCDSDEHSRIMDFFGVKESDIPTVRIINLAADMANYKLAEPISVDSLRKFTTDYLAGSLKPHLMSEAVPADWDAKPVKVLTGENFDKVVRESKKHVLVEFYAPWCGHCKQLTPTWDKLAEKYAKHSDIIIAKIDSTQNEVHDIRVQSFPTIKLFSPGEAEPTDYSGHRSLADLSKFLAEKTGHSIELTAEEQAEADDGAGEEYDHYEDGHEGHDHGEGEGEGEGEGHDEL